MQSGVLYKSIISFPLPIPTSIRLLWMVHWGLIKRPWFSCALLLFIRRQLYFNILPCTICIGHQNKSSIKISKKTMQHVLQSNGNAVNYRCLLLSMTRLLSRIMLVKANHTKPTLNYPGAYTCRARRSQKPTFHHSCWQEAKGLVLCFFHLSLFLATP